MLSFEEVFSLDELQTLLLSKDKHVDPVTASLRCIGYHDGLVLFVYYTTRDSSMVTKIGCYCVKEMELRILYTHGDKIDVLTGSLNEEKTLLVYARRKHSKSSTFLGYLVELENLKTFDLGIETPHHQHLKFFPWRNSREMGQRREHLVFFLEKRRIGVLHIVITVSDTGKLEVQQIQKEFLVQQYVWYQLDINNMRLYYIYLQQKVSGKGVKEYSCMFNVYQFSSRSNPEVVLSANLPLPITPDLYTESKRYMLGPFSSRQPDCHVNVSVIRPQSTADSLVLCIALKGRYFVYLVHAGQLVEYTKEDLGSTIFLDLHSYLIVYSPPNTLHFIDSSSDHDGCNRMAIETVPMPHKLLGTGRLEQKAGSVMPLCVVESSNGSAIVALHQATLYRVEIEEGAVMKMYRETSCSALSSFLLHLALSHVKNVKLSHRMILHSMKNYPENRNMPELLKEYLLTATHTALSQEGGITPHVLGAVPFNVEESPVLERNRELKVSNVYTLITKPMVAAQKIQNIVAHTGPFIRFNLEEFVSRCGHVGRSHSSRSVSGHSSNNSASSGETEENPEEDDISETLTNALEYHLRRRFNETVPLASCQDAARSYFTLLAEHCRYLLALALISIDKPPSWVPVSITAGDPGMGPLLRLLDLMKYAWVRLGCSPPAQFEWLHVCAAHASLPRQVLLRRLSSRSIRISPATVGKILGAVPTHPLCRDLVAALPRSQALLAIRPWDHPDYRRFTAQNYLIALREKVGLNTPAEPTTETPPFLRAHPFIPVNSFYSFLFHKLNSPDSTRKLHILSEGAMEITRNSHGDETLADITFY